MNPTKCKYDSIYMEFRSGKTNLWWQRSEQWLPLGRGMLLQLEKGDPGDFSDGNVLPLDPGGHYMGKSVWDLWTLCMSVCVLSHTRLFVTPVEPDRLLCPWNFPGKNTRMGCHFLLQGSFWLMDLMHISCTGRKILYHCATWKHQLYFNFKNIQKNTTLSKRLSNTSASSKWHWKHLWGI